MPDKRRKKKGTPAKAAEKAAAAAAAAAPAGAAAPATSAAAATAAAAAEPAALAPPVPQKDVDAHPFAVGGHLLVEWGADKSHRLAEIIERVQADEEEWVYYVHYLDVSIFSAIHLPQSPPPPLRRRSLSGFIPCLRTLPCALV
jgi:hypothetical protein